MACLSLAFFQFSLKGLYWLENNIAKAPNIYIWHNNKLNIDHCSYCSNWNNWCCRLGTFLFWQWRWQVLSNKLFQSCWKLVTVKVIRRIHWVLFPLWLGASSPWKTLLFPLICHPSVDPCTLWFSAFHWLPLIWSIQKEPMTTSMQIPGEYFTTILWTLHIKRLTGARGIVARRPNSLQSFQ